MHPRAAAPSFSSILQLHEGHHLCPACMGQWDQPKKHHIRNVDVEKHSVQRAESSQSNLLPPPSSKEQGALKLSQASQPAQAVQCFPALLFPGRQLQPRSPRCSAVMGSGCPNPT